jgi:MFS family permease
MDLPVMFTHKIKFCRIFLRKLFTVNPATRLAFWLSTVIVFIISWIFTNNTLFLILGIISLFAFIHEVLRYLNAREEVFLEDLFPLKKQSLSFKDLIISYLIDALVTIFVVIYVGLYVLQLSMEVVYLMIGMIIIVYSTIGYIFFIRNRQKLEQLLRNNI